MTRELIERRGNGQESYDHAVRAFAQSAAGLASGWLAEMAVNEAKRA
jgi:hypothetical protein